MALQDRNLLSMVGLGTLQNEPGNPLQPKLVDAVHLRWACGPGIGFPWHGFYLYRRNARAGKKFCVGDLLANRQPGPMGSNVWASGNGTVTSDRPLVLRDDIPPQGRCEIDLGDRGFVEFLPLELSYAVDLAIGFRKQEGNRRRCLDFTAMRPQVLPNPYQRQRMLLVTFDANNQPNPSNQMAQTGGDGAFLLTGRCSIKTEEIVGAIELRIVGPSEIETQAFDGAGNRVEGKLVSSPGQAVQVYRLEGIGLHDATMAHKGEAFLLSVCLEGDDLAPWVEIPVTAFLGESEVAQVVMAGLAGDVASASLRADAMDRIRIASGPASLVELCWSSVFEGAQRGWEPVDKIVQPITLPVRHPDYPACGNLPTDLPASRADALQRVKYGDPNEWAAPFDDIHEQCLNLVRGGPAVPMTDPGRAVSFPVETEPGDTSTPPSIPSLHPLQLVLLASLHAPISQILGLAWSDETAEVEKDYDYLIVADHQGRAGHQVLKVLSLVTSEGFANLDGYIVFGKRVEKAEPLFPPSDARGYALPGTTRPDLTGGTIDASCNAGLRWYLPMVNNVLLPESPVLYHLWRTGYGPLEPAQPAHTPDFDPLTKEAALIVVENLLSISGVQRPPDWPPFPLYGLDNAVQEGWYGYRVSNVDVFGRHSALGPDARWFEWAPRPDPEPWYYQDPPGDRSVHPFAVALLDKIPPPPPTGTEAYALDPKDPFVQRDAAYDAWFATLSASEQETVVGLRVRWQWTDAHMRQAPDTVEFRIYYEGGRLNARLGQTVDVVPAGATESLVRTDIANAHPAGAFAGCSLKVGPDIFTVVDSEAGTPLRLRIRNVGPLNDVAPPPRANCEVNIPNNHALFVNYGQAHAWEERVYVVGFDEHVTVDVDGAGRPLRRYELFLPAPNEPVREGLPLQPNLAEPVKLAAIGVTACDGRTHTADHPKWNTGRWGGHVGNESVVSPPAIVFRVLRDPPPPPAPPPDAERIFATAADYHAASFYTYRWVPQAHLKTHVYRAMDDTVFNVDWKHQPRAAITANDPIFPDEAVEPRWNAPKRQQVAQELNVLNTFPQTPAGKEQARRHYRGLSNDGLRVLANLPNNEEAFAQVTVAPLDPNDPATANRVGPDNPPNFPIDPNLRIYVDTLDGRSTNRYFYRARYVDGAHNRSAPSLSSPPVWLPNVTPPRAPALVRITGGERQITLEWSSNREPDLAEYRIYRADDESSTRDLRLMALVQTVPVLPGEAEDRPAIVSWTDAPTPGLVTFQYRLVAVDDAGNASEPSPPRSGRAHDQALPVVPQPAIAWVDQGGKVRAEISWTSEHEVLVQRRESAGGPWVDLTSWRAPGSVTIRDPFSDPANSYQYRLWARKYTGAVVRGAPIPLEAQ